MLTPYEARIRKLIPQLSISIIRFPFGNIQKLSRTMKNKRGQSIKPKVEVVLLMIDQPRNKWLENNIGYSLMY